MFSHEIYHNRHGKSLYLVPSAHKSLLKSTEEASVSLTSHPGKGEVVQVDPGFAFYRSVNGSRSRVRPRKGLLVNGTKLVSRFLISYLTVDAHLQYQ